MAGAMGRQVRGLVVAAVALCCFAGCDEGVLCHSGRLVPAEGWRSRDTLVFDVDTLRDNAVCRFEIGLRVTVDYPYKSIWLGVERDFSPPAVLRRDTVECLLVDSTLRMDGGIHLYQCVVPLPSMQLQRGQAGQIRVVHLMSRESRRARRGHPRCPLRLVLAGQVAACVDAKEDEQQDGEAP